MKKHALLILTLCSSTALRGFAQDAPPAPPPALSGPTAPPTPPAPADKHQSRAFLGLEVGRVPAALGDQLRLPDGFGVLVDYVVPGSAAEAAGIKSNDILKSVDGQIVTSAQHLAVLVRSFAPGQEVALVVLHKGQETKLTAQLQKRPDQEANRNQPGARRTDKEENDDDEFGSDKDQAADWQQKLRASLERNRAQTDAATRRAMEESRRALEEAREQTARAFASRTEFGPARIVLRDPTGRVELRVVRGKRTLRVRDDKGETVFEGPVNTPEQRKAVPPDALPKLEALEHEQETVFPKDDE